MFGVVLVLFLTHMTVDEKLCHLNQIFVNFYLKGVVRNFFQDQRIFAMRAHRSVEDQTLPSFSQWLHNSEQKKFAATIEMNGEANKLITDLDAASSFVLEAYLVCQENDDFQVLADRYDEWLKENADKLTEINIADSLEAFAESSYRAITESKRTHVATEIEGGATGAKL